MLALIIINIIMFFVGMFVGMLMIALISGIKSSDEDTDWYGQDKW